MRIAFFIDDYLPSAVVIKATEVLMAQGSLKISARNKFEGKVSSVEKGAVNSIVKLTTNIGNVTSTI